MTGEVIDSALVVLDEYLRGAPVHVTIALRTIRGVARRAKRISSTTLPAVLSVAHQAITVRDALRSVHEMHGLALPLELQVRVREALALAEQLVAATSTGAPEG